MAKGRAERAEHGAVETQGVTSPFSISDIGSSSRKAGAVAAPVEAAV